MKTFLINLFLLICPLTLLAQTNIYVSNNGTNTGQSLPTINNPVKTLEQAYAYIENNLVNSNNVATTPINVFLKDDGGEILVSSTQARTLDWEVSGTSSNPIYYIFL